MRPSTPAGRIISSRKPECKTAHLDEIVRQRDPELKADVEQLSRGDVYGGVERLDQQGRVYEIASREERLTAIANEYVKRPARDARCFAG